MASRCHYGTQKKIVSCNRAIASGEVPMNREGATPLGVKEEDSVEARRVAIVDEGTDFGEEAGGNLVGEEVSAALETWPKESAIKATRMTKTKVEDGREVLVAEVEDEEISSSMGDRLCWTK